MDVWIITRGEYDDETIVGVVTSEAEAFKLKAESNGRYFDDAIRIYGPFQPGSVDALAGVWGALPWCSEGL